MPLFPLASHFFIDLQFGAKLCKTTIYSNAAHDRGFRLSFSDNSFYKEKPG